MARFGRTAGSGRSTPRTRVNASGQSAEGARSVHECESCAVPAQHGISYHDWRLELGALDAQTRITRRWPLDWKLTGLCPGEVPREWSAQPVIDGPDLAGQTLALRVINPIANGKPLRFANADQDQHLSGWLSLGKVPAGP